MAKMDMSGMGAGVMQGFVDGEGGYFYKLLQDGSYQILGPTGRMTLAKPGSRAHESISLELAGEENLYGVPAAGKVEVGPESDFESSSDDVRAAKGYAAAAKAKADRMGGETILARGQSSLITDADSNRSKKAKETSRSRPLSVEDRIKAIEDKLFGAQSMDEPFPTSPSE
jgi:hypothetical protein